MIFGLLALTGCATQPQATGEPADSPFRPAYAPAAAGALAFDPPIAAGLPLPDFSRDGRAIEAFAGYETQVTAIGYSHQRDEIRVQTPSGELFRQAYTDRTSTLTR